VIREREGREMTVGRPFQQVDVFSEEPLRGNPLAVVLDGAGLTTEQMERFARWTNLSEATFLVGTSDRAADYAVRIFTQAGELPFAGHPTLGTCHAWLTSGGRPRDPDHIVQECPAGLIPIRRIDDVLAFAAPPTIRSGRVEDDDLGRIARILGIEPGDVVASQWVDNGPGWVAVMLESAEAVLALHPSEDGAPFDIGVVGRYATGDECAYEVRAFFTNERCELMEDPVTGSLHASLAQWLVDSGAVVPPYVAGQGAAIGRTGRARITQDADGVIWVGGTTRTFITGEVDVE
jgi:PhzF family phenazine biosynthesis protein